MIDVPPGMLGVLPSLIVLSIAALAALVLSRNRRSRADDPAAPSAAARALGVTACIQAVHFAEEMATGLHVRLPELFGLPPMPFPLFVAFNLVWLVIWLACLPGLLHRGPFALFAAWFLAVAGVANGAGHPLLAVAAGGYFPGLVTSPAIGLAGVWLWRRLRVIT